MLIYLGKRVQSLGTGVRFVLPNVLSSKSNIVLGGGGYHFHLRGDLLRRPLKGRQSTFAAILRCVPITFGNDCSLDRMFTHSLPSSDWVNVVNTDEVKAVR